MWLTGENKEVAITLTFSGGDVIDNYDQIQCSFFHYVVDKSRAKTVAKVFSLFALDPVGAGLPVGVTYRTLMVSGNTITCAIPAEDTDDLDIGINNSTNVYVSVKLGDKTQTFAKNKPKPTTGTDCDLFVAEICKAPTEGWN